MNTLLSPISWNVFIQGLLFLLGIYYLLVSTWIFRNELHHMIKYGSFKPAGKDQGSPFFALQTEAASETVRQPNIFQHLEGPDEILLEADTLIAGLRAGIAEFSELPYQPLAVPQKLKALFHKHQQLKNTSHRAAINELVVAECEKTGIAALTEEEVDQWWSD